MADLLFGTLNNMFWNENAFVCVDLNKSCYCFDDKFHAHSVHPYMYKNDAKKYNCDPAQRGHICRMSGYLRWKKRQSLTESAAFHRHFFYVLLALNWKLKNFLENPAD